MRNGTVYRLPTLAPHTSGIGSGLLPTPTATGDVHKLERLSKRNTMRSNWRYLIAGHRIRIASYLIEAGYSAFQMVTFIESMMGFPKNWTASEREWVTARLAIKERRSKLLGLDAPAKQEISAPGGGPIQTDMKVILDALADPKTSDALKAIAQRMEGYPSDDGD